MNNTVPVHQPRREYPIDGRRQRRYYRRMRGRGVMVAAFAGLLGCGGARPLDPTGHAGQGASSGPTGQGAIVGAGRAGRRGAATIDAPHLTRHAHARPNAVARRADGIDLIAAAATGCPTRCATHPRPSSRPTAQPSSITAASDDSATSCRRTCSAGSTARADRSSRAGRGPSRSARTGRARSAPMPTAATTGRSSRTPTAR